MGIEIWFAAASGVCFAASEQRPSHSAVASWRGARTGLGLAVLHRGHICQATSRTDPLATHPALAVATLQPGSRNKAQALRDIHGLTATEARIALQLASGKTASDIASDSGVALTTMRTHIASALGKLGLTRQAQLVGRVLTV